MTKKKKARAPIADDMAVPDMESVIVAMQDNDVSAIEVVDLLYDTYPEAYRGVVVEVSDCSLPKLVAHLMSVASAILLDDAEKIGEDDDGQALLRTRDGVAYHVIPV